MSPTVGIHIMGWNRILRATPTAVMCMVQWTARSYFRKGADVAELMMVELPSDLLQRSTLTLAYIVWYVDYPLPHQFR